MYHMDKQCALCGAALHGRERKFCSSCREEAEKQRRAAYIRKRKAEQKLTAAKKQEPCYTRCRGCLYFDGKDKTCQYMLKTGQRRESDPAQCDKRIGRKRWDISM